MISRRPPFCPRPSFPSWMSSSLAHLDMCQSRFKIFNAPNSPVISTSPSCSIAFSIALRLALFCSFSSFRAFFADMGARGPLVGCRTLLLAVPRGFLEILLLAFFDCVLDLLAMRRCLLGTFGFPRDGILRFYRIYCMGIKDLWYVKRSIEDLCGLCR